MKHKKIILVDNGHGEETAGKRSPDGAFREYLSNRIIAKTIVEDLCGEDYDARLLVPENNDIPLPERVRRVNTLCNTVGKDNVILLSIHSDALGNGTEWNDARGWTAWTSVGQTRSDDIAECLYDVADIELAEYAKTFPPKRKHIRTDTQDGDRDYEAQFYILRKTLCPAVLTENCFMTNKDDVAWLSSEQGIRTIVKIHVAGIINYLDKYGEE